MRGRRRERTPARRVPGVTLADAGPSTELRVVSLSNHEMVSRQWPSPLGARHES
jgi:hypothetical protein